MKSSIAVLSLAIMVCMVMAQPIEVRQDLIQINRPVGSPLSQYLANRPAPPGKKPVVVSQAPVRPSISQQLGNKIPSLLPAKLPIVNVPNNKPHVPNNKPNIDMFNGKVVPTPKYPAVYYESLKQENEEQ